MTENGYPDVEVLIYGSTANGLSIRGSSSDIDTSLQISSPKFA
jgi:DNA polymerase sigma